MKHRMLFHLVWQSIDTNCIPSETCIWKQSHLIRDLWADLALHFVLQVYGDLPVQEDEPNLGDQY